MLERELGRVEAEKKAEEYMASNYTPTIGRWFEEMGVAMKICAFTSIAVIVFALFLFGFNAIWILILGMVVTWFLRKIVRHRIQYAIIVCYPILLITNIVILVQRL